MEVTLKKKKLQEVMEFLEHELDDLSGIKNWDFGEGDENEIEVKVEIHVNRRLENRSVYMRFANEKLQVRLGEDTWNTVEYYQDSVKYFWWALLWT